MLLGFGLLLARPAQASHAVGGDLTYRSLGNNRYEVNVTFFRDCSGIVASPTFPLICRNGSNCGGTTVTATLSPVGTPLLNSPYCPAVQSIINCTLTGPSAPSNPTSYLMLRYQGIVTLPPGQWTLGVEESARPNLANISNPASLRLEATLNNSSGLVNSSPTFSNLALFDLPWKRTTISQIGAFDADGDSLVFALGQPLNGCGSYETYSNYQGSMCLPGIISNNPVCLLSCGTNHATYSATLPIAVLNDTVGTCPNKTVVPAFQFDASSGSFVITPGRYDSTSVSAVGANKYAVVVKVSEYRRINGAYVNIGSVRRDLMFTVFSCGTNQLPRFAPAVGVWQGLHPAVSQPMTQIIPVHAGEPVNVLLTGTDANPGQAVSFDLHFNSTPGAQLQNLGNGTARLTYTPAYNLPDGLYRISVNLNDNACPIKGFETRSVLFRVYGSALASHTGKATAAPAAWPNPFTDQVQFQLLKAGVQALTITDNLGRSVATVASQADGFVRWQPGSEVPAGLYLARTADGQQTVRLLRK